MLLEECDVSSIELDEEVVIEKLNYKNILPKEGIFLGLDISKNSTGFCLVDEGEINTGNITLNEELEDIIKEGKGEFREVLLRRVLKGYLTEIVNGLSFNAIIIEDVYSGENPETSRMLYSLNTVIDELILDGVCSCSDFRRVSNKVWKSWLSKRVDDKRNYKGLNDKEKVKNYLLDLGVVEDGEGYQDRLDATGMVLGYLLEGEKEEKKDGTRKVTWSKLEFDIDSDKEFILDNSEWLKDLIVEEVYLPRVSKKKVLEIINKDPTKVYISSNEVFLGSLSKSMGLEEKAYGGGKLGFWVKKSKREE